MSFKTAGVKIAQYVLKDYVLEWLRIGVFLSVIGIIIFAFCYFDWSFQSFISIVFSLWMVYCAIAGGCVVVYYCLQALFDKFGLKSKVLFGASLCFLIMIAVPVIFLLQNSCFGIYWKSSYCNY
ncbi:hypothetical protein EYS14_14795 [Alteromonadaceae bacterium M269]|nr:hypothetical protein EYS14_14795 [Alteromonadaceae bacterium M269]